MRDNNQGGDPALAPPRLRGRPFTILAIVALVFSIGATGRWVIDFGPRWFYHTDYDVYRAGGQAFLNGENLYTQVYSVVGIDLPFTYPPLAAILFSPLALIPYSIGSAAMTVASAIVLWWCIVIVLRQCLPTFATSDVRLLALFILPLALLLEPLSETLYFGQINVFLMALVLADTLTRRKWLPRGVLIGLAAAIKLTPAVFGLVFLVRRQWKDAAVTTASGIGFTALAAIISPHNSVTYWLHTLSDPTRIGNLKFAANQSIQGMLSRFAEAGQEAPRQWWVALVALALFTIIVALVRIERNAATRGVDPTLALVLVTSFVSLLCSPVSWSHHWTWLVPLAVTLGVNAYRMAPGTPRSIAGLLAVVVTLVGLLGAHWRIQVPRDMEYLWPWWSQATGNSYLLVATLVLITVILIPHVLLPQAPSSVPGTQPMIPSVLLRAWILVIILGYLGIVVPIVVPALIA
ncbi:glycosyltransferase 87 family protein [Corynebacterium atrinae]|uniref:glycosyltransferase 87 family protein n=1 Tax=Corynebacterium atrinae TaxID=1336740 RepID=UPI0025B2EEE7|nr:glycosyltransferase 87 family protein [Corynebacterium atrinae]